MAWDFIKSRKVAQLAVLLGMAALVLAGRQCLGSENLRDEQLAAARRYVEQSDRYMHHSRLKRGMKGYGLTVMEGTKIARFEAEVISVITGWQPHPQEAILARLSGLNLEKTSLISGMSGSPVFIHDPADGKDKIVGAVAFGWSGQKEPLCGIQPITHMLAIRGFLADDVDKIKAEGTEKLPAPVSVRAPAWYLSVVLNPHKIDFSQFAWPPQSPQPDQLQQFAIPQLEPLNTPLMISGLSRQAIQMTGRVLATSGLVPVQAGGAAMEDADAEAPKLVPGGAISVPLVTGYVDISAIGTVTDVVDGRVLAFGHTFLGGGDVEFPMGPAYIHTTVSHLIGSFKLGSSLMATGAISRDEAVGILGRVGRQIKLIPMTVNVNWPDDGREQTFTFSLCRHRWLTPLLTSALINESALGWRDLPDTYTLRYSVDIDFGRLGVYHVDNIATGGGIGGAWSFLFGGGGIGAVASDASRPVAAMLNNPFADVPEITRIDVNIEIRSGRIGAKILDLKLDGSVYRPGETVTGKLLVRPYKKERHGIPVRFLIPPDLPEGNYVLTACDYVAALDHLRKEMPHRFDPRTLEELFAAIQRTVKPRADMLYLRLPLRRGGLAMGKRELPDLPPSKLAILSEAGRIDVKPFIQALEHSLPSEYVLDGSAEAQFKVQEKPKETRIRQQAKGLR